jgi:uncharacterized protein YukE
MQNQIDKLKGENGTLKTTIENLQDAVRKLGERTTGKAAWSNGSKNIANQLQETEFSVFFGHPPIMGFRPP